MNKKEKLELLNRIVAGEYGDCPCCYCSESQKISCCGCSSMYQYKDRVKDLEKKLSPQIVDCAFALCCRKKSLEQDKLDFKKSLEDLKAML